MNEVQVFQNSEFGELGVLEVNGKPYFPATACAKVLGYQRPQDTVRQHCRYSMKCRVPHPQNPSKEIEMNFIPEGDLYRLIVHSKLPAAERFEKWVFDEVLPTIRKTGGYGNQERLMGKMLEQLAQVTTSLAQVASVIVGAASGADDLSEEPRKRRKATSIINRLDVDARKEVEAMICSGQYTYTEIAQHLADCGIRISVTSVWRYAQSMN